MGWERKRGKLAEFNRLLRGATDTSFVVVHGDSRGPARDQVRHHARLRHAAADGGGAPPGRHPVASAQPAAVRCAPAARHRRLRRAAAARAGQRRERGPHDVRAGLLRPRRPRSVHHRGVRRLPGPVSRGQLRRQGHLRRRRVRGGARRAGARERAAQPRPVRGPVRARGAVHRHRPGGRLPVELPGVRGAPAPLGARRLADRPLALAHGARRAAAARCRTRCPPSRAGRFSTTSAAACSRRRSSRSSSPAGRCCRGRRIVWSVLRRCWSSPFPPTCRSADR